MGRFGRRRARIALGLAAVGLSLLPLVPFPAGADEISDKRAEAERIASRVHELNERIEVLAEEYNAAQDQLAKVEADEAAAQASLEQTKTEMSQRERELAAYAVRAYVRGGDRSTLPVILGSNGADIGQRQGYLTAAAGNRQQLLDQLEAVRQDVELDVTRLAQAKAAATQVRTTIASKHEATESAAAEQRSLLSRAQGELADLIRQEQERRAAADAAAARARAEAASRVQPPPSRTGGGSSGGTSPGGGGTIAPPPGVKGGAEGAVAEAKRQLGVRYTWGGSTPESGFDCSGFTSWAWRVGGGVSLPHNSRSQYSATTHIPMSSIQPGDLIFYGQPTIHHVALYVGGGQIIHAPNSGSHVRYDSVYYWDELVGAGRV